MFHQQGNQQPSDASVAIEEWMDCLELHMRKPNPNQRRELTIFMQPLLQRSKRGGNLLGRWRNEASVARFATANPVLRSTDFSRTLVLATNAAHQDTVGIAQ